MNLEERKNRIEQLKQKHPELKKMYGWYSVVKAVELCQEENINNKMDDRLTVLLETIEDEIIKLKIS